MTFRRMLTPYNKDRGKIYFEERKKTEHIDPTATTAFQKKTEHVDPLDLGLIN